LTVTWILTWTGEAIRDKNSALGLAEGPKPSFLRHGEPAAWASSMCLRAEAQRDATVELPADIAWRLFTKGIAPTDVERAAVITGDRELAGAVFRVVAILA
jgi:hypothetical protein